MGRSLRAGGGGVTGGRAMGIDVEDVVHQNGSRTVLDRCEGLGMATGVVTSVQFAHATPAAASTPDTSSSERTAVWGTVRKALRSWATRSARVDWLIAPLNEPFIAWANTAMKTK